MTVELGGFAPATRRSITLEVGQTLAIDITLNVAGQTEAVDVVAKAPLVESLTSHVDQTVTREMLAACRWRRWRPASS